MSYLVYTHKTPNGKIYVGVTKRDYKHRWASGFGYRSNDYFFKAIVKYGWDNIEHTIVATDLTQEEAEAMEIELIKKYHSDNRAFGYNHASGGFSKYSYKMPFAIYRSTWQVRDEGFEGGSILACLRQGYSNMQGCVWRFATEEEREQLYQLGLDVLRLRNERSLL